MRKIFALIAILIALVFSGATSASEHVYVVKKGDSLWKIGKMFNTDWKEIAKFNQIENPEIIYPGQEIFINGNNFIEKGDFIIKKVSGKRDPFERLIYPKPEKTVVVAKKAAGIVFLNGTINPKLYTDEEIGDDPWKGDLSELLMKFGYPEDKAIALEEKVKTGNSEDFGHIRSGDAFWMGSGKNKVGYYTMSLTDKKRLIATKVYFTEGYSVQINLWCGNPIVGIEIPKKEILVQPAAEIPQIMQVPAPITQIPQISFPAVPKAPWCWEHQPIAGAGAWDNALANGRFAYGEYLLYLKKCSSEWSYGAGVYGIYGEGNSEISSYEWEEWGIGPQIAVKRYWFYKDDKGKRRPQQWEMKLRLIWEDTNGENDEGYRMSQDNLKAGIYTEYVRQMSDRWHLIFIGEGWLAFDKSISSTWSGDSPQERSQLMGGIYAQYKYNNDWQFRFGGGPFFQDWDDMTGLHIRAEARWKEIIMFGPYANLFAWKSSVYDGTSLGDLQTIGGFVRVEFGNPIRKWDQKRRMERIWADDEEDSTLDNSKEESIMVD